MRSAIIMNTDLPRPTDMWDYYEQHVLGINQKYILRPISKFGNDIVESQSDKENCTVSKY